MNRICLKTFTSGNASTLKIDHTFDFLEYAMGSYHFEFLEAPFVSGTLRKKGTSIEAQFTARILFKDHCDRCLEEFPNDCSVDVSGVLCEEEKDSEDDCLLLEEDGSLSLDRILEEALIAHGIEPKLCQEDCEGLCPICGEKMIEGQCGCKVEKPIIDPRFEKLKNLKF